MPYFREQSLHSSVDGSVRGTHSSGASYSGEGPTNFKLVNQLTWRTRGPRGTLVSHEVPDYQADPYANLIRGAEDRKRDSATANGSFKPPRGRVAVKSSFDRFTVDRGHPWDFLSYEVGGTPLTCSWSDTTWNYVAYQADMILTGRPVSGPQPFRSVAPPLPFNLDAWAQAKYASAATYSSADVMQFLGELREGLPKMLPAFLLKSKNFKDLGGDYLNVEFGWKPFLADIQAIGQALLGATQTMVGPTRPVHRSRGEEPDITLESRRGLGRVAPFSSYLGAVSGNFKKTDFSFPQDPAYTHYVGAGGPSIDASWVSTQRIEARTWFEGSFTFLPKVGFDPDSYLDRLEYLLDPQLTPGTLWELAPWTWLTDWFLNIGNSIAANEAATSNRVLSQYAYAMRSEVTEQRTLLTNLSAPRYAGPSSLIRENITTRKRRVRANPYGFKPMTGAGLNSGQLLILGALGLAKSGR